jgi:hypothetical protein
MAAFQGRRAQPGVAYHPKGIDGDALYRGARVGKETDQGRNGLWAAQRGQGHAESGDDASRDRSAWDSDEKPGEDLGQPRHGSGIFALAQQPGREGAHVGAFGQAAQGAQEQSRGLGLVTVGDADQSGLPDLGASRWKARMSSSLPSAVHSSPKAAISALRTCGHGSCLAPAMMALADGLSPLRPRLAAAVSRTRGSYRPAPRAGRARSHPLAHWPVR